MFNENLSDLSDMLQQEEWFILAKGRLVKNSIDTVIYEMTFKGLVSDITVFVDDKKSPIRIKSNMSGKAKRCSTLNRALVVVRETFADVLPILDERATTQKEQEERQAKVKKRRDEVVALLGKEKFNASNSIYNSNALCYEPSNEHILQLHINNDDTLGLRRMAGNYTIDEIKQLMEWMATCPSVVSRRLLK